MLLTSTVFANDAQFCTHMINVLCFGFSNSSIKSGCMIPLHHTNKINVVFLFRGNEIVH